MRWILLALALVAISLITDYSRMDLTVGDTAVSSGASDLPSQGFRRMAEQSELPVRAEAKFLGSGEYQDVPALAVETEDQPVGFNTSTETVKSKAPLDPDDPMALYDDDPEVIIVGEPRDPDDPMALYDEDAEVIQIGTPTDPDDPLSLIEEDPVVIVIGTPRDPNDPYLLIDEDSEVIRTGDPIDPDLWVPEG